jgi:hypothetical protein
VHRRACLSASAPVVQIWPAICSLRCRVDMPGATCPTGHADLCVLTWPGTAQALSGQESKNRRRTCRNTAVMTLRHCLGTLSYLSAPAHVDPVWLQHAPAWEPRKSQAIPNTASTISRADLPLLCHASPPVRCCKLMTVHRDTNRQRALGRLTFLEFVDATRGH